MRFDFRSLCLVLLGFAALACRDQTQKAETTPTPSLPFWAQQLCENWHRRDGSCDQATLIADYEECFKTQGVPAEQGLRKAGVGNRASLRAGERQTNLCLELRHWMMTETGARRWEGGASGPPPAAKPAS